MAKMLVDVRRYELLEQLAASMEECLYTDFAWKADIEFKRAQECVNKLFEKSIDLSCA